MAGADDHAVAPDDATGWNASPGVDGDDRLACLLNGASELRGELGERAGFRWCHERPVVGDVLTFASQVSNHHRINGGRARPGVEGLRVISARQPRIAE